MYIIKLLVENNPYNSFQKVLYKKEKNQMLHLKKKIFLECVLNK